MSKLGRLVERIVGKQEKESSAKVSPWIYSSEKEMEILAELGKALGRQTEAQLKIAQCIADLKQYEEQKEGER